MLHDLVKMRFLVGKVVLTPAWNYGKQWVQELALAAALYYLVIVFIAFYVSQPRPLAARGVGCPVAP